MRVPVALVSVALVSAALLLVAASIPSADVLGVVFPAIVLGARDEVFSSLGFLPCRAITPPESACYSVIPGAGFRSWSMLTVPSAHLKCQYTAYDTRSSPIYRTRVASYNARGHSSTSACLPELLKIFKKCCAGVAGCG